MFKHVIKFKTFFFSLFIALFTSFLVWYILLSLSYVKEPIQHPSPTGKVLSKYAGQQISPQGEEIRWLELIGDETGWFKKADQLPLQPEFFASQHTLVIANGKGPRLASQLQKFLKDNKLVDKVTILSSADGLLKDLRFIEPEIALSYGQAFLIRLHAMEQIALQNMLTFDKDVAWLKPEIFHASMKSLIPLFLSRNIPVIIGPVKKETADQWNKETILLTY